MERDIVFRRFGPGFCPPGPGMPPHGQPFEEPIFFGHPAPHPPGGFRRRFRTREERIAELEAYLRALEAEAQGVREALEELRRGQRPESSGQP